MTGGNTLFHLVRSLTGPQFTYGVKPTHGRMVMAVEAVDAVLQRGAVTINDLADELGIDQSGASRLVSQAIAAGYIQRNRGQEDGRARECGLTPAGEDLLHTARRWQEETFARLTADWTESERTQFESQMQRLIAAANPAVADGARDGS